MWGLLSVVDVCDDDTLSWVDMALTICIRRYGYYTASLCHRQFFYK